MKFTYLILMAIYSLAVFAQDDLLQSHVLKFIDQYPPTTIDPITVYETNSVRLTEILFGALYSKNRAAERIPELADGDPELTPDGTSAIIKLKENIKFTDGSPIRPEDIIFTFKAGTNPNSENFNPQTFAFIKSIAKLDNHKIRVEFTRPVTDPRRYLMFFIIPESAFFDEAVTRDLGYCREPQPSSGGYELITRTTTSTQFLFRKNKYYVGKANPQIDEIQMNVFTDIMAHADLLKNELTDLILFVPPASLPELKRDSRFTIEPYDANQYDFIAFNFSNPILQFIQFRQALNLAFNREEMLASFFHGDGTLMSGPFPPSHFGSNPEVEPWEYDQNMAVQILDNLGFVDTDGDGIREVNGKPIELKLLTSIGDATYNSIISSFVQQMSNIGIRIKVEQYIASIFENKVRNGEFDLVYYTRKVSAEGNYAPFFLSSEAYAGGKNIGYYQNDVVDSLFIKAQATLDFTLRAEIYQELHKILREECPYIYLWYLRYNAAYVRKLRNVSIDPYYFFTTIEEWYFED